MLVNRMPAPSIPVVGQFLLKPADHGTQIMVFLCELLNSLLELRGAIASVLLVLLDFGL
jgi:hypothetical protein